MRIEWFNCVPEVFAEGTRVSAESEESGERALNDAELVALAAVAQIDALSMQSENQQRLSAGMAPAYVGFTSGAIERLDRELHRRGVL